MIKLNHICLKESRAIASADKMVSHLLRVTFLCALKDLNAYVGKVESIVFELLAQHVYRGSRKTRARRTRPASRSGLAVRIPMPALGRQSWVVTIQKHSVRC